MKREMSFGDVVSFYETTMIEQTDNGFELPDDGCGFTTEILRNFYVFLDGKLIDPAEMLVDRMGWMRQELIKTFGVCAPVTLSYAFGSLVEVEGKKRFRFQDPMESTVDSMEVLIEADWDERQGVANTRWVEEVEKHWGQYILHQKTVSGDVYGTYGTQFWILHITKSMERMMELKVDFYTWQRHLIENSDGILKKFESEKEQYREKMKECLGQLQGKIHWLSAEEEELWPAHDANRELWQTGEYDWQVIDSCERVEVHGRGGSPGVILAMSSRCDGVGLQSCRSFVARHT